MARPSSRAPPEEEANVALKNAERVAQVVSRHAEEAVLQGVESDELLVQAALLHDGGEVARHLQEDVDVDVLVGAGFHAGEEHEANRLSHGDEGAGEAGPDPFHHDQFAGLRVGVLPVILRKVVDDARLAGLDNGLEAATGQGSAEVLAETEVGIASPRPDGPDPGPLVPTRLEEREADPIVGQNRLEALEDVIQDLVEKEAGVDLSGHLGQLPYLQKAGLQRLAEVSQIPTQPGHLVVSGVSQVVLELTARHRLSRPSVGCDALTGAVGFRHDPSSLQASGGDYTPNCIRRKS